MRPPAVRLQECHMGQGARNRSKVLPQNCRHLTENIELELQSPAVSYGERHPQRTTQVINEWITL